MGTGRVVELCRWSICIAVTWESMRLNNTSQSSGVFGKENGSKHRALRETCRKMVKGGCFSLLWHVKGDAQVWDGSIVLLAVLKATDGSRSVSTESWLAACRAWVTDSRTVSLEWPFLQPDRFMSKYHCAYLICLFLTWCLILTLFADGRGESQCSPRHSHCRDGWGRWGLEAGWDPLSRGWSTNRSATCYASSPSLSGDLSCSISTKTSHIRTVSNTLISF